MLLEESQAPRRSRRVLRWISPVELALVALFCAASAHAAVAAPPPTGRGSHVMVVETPFKGSVLYAPADGEPHPGVVVLHGSEGGSDEGYRVQAVLLAANGYAALAFCYFDCERPLTEFRAPLAGVELGDTEAAIRWLRSSEYVKNRRVALYGYSRGAELAALVASHAEGPSKPDALVLHAATDVTTGQSNWDWFDSRCWLCEGGRVTCNWKTPVERRQWSPSCGQASPVDEKFKLRGAALPAWTARGAAIPKGRAIMLERYDGAILITHGKSDQVWSYQGSVRLKDRLIAAGRKRVTLELFDNEGHSFEPANETRRWDLIVRFLAPIS